QEDEVAVYQHCANCLDCQRIFGALDDSPEDAAPDLGPPREFDHYQILRSLGRGAMGQVFLGRDTRLDRPVAVKFMTAQAATEEERARFLVEARAIARLTHPNVISIYRVGEERGWPYLVSELIDGQSLEKVDKP